MALTRTYDGAEPVRLNKFMGQAGLSSRREADALIAEAKGASRAEEPYTPVFDFGPGPAQTAPVASAPAPAVDWGRPAWDPGVAPSRPFGRRT